MRRAARFLLPALVLCHALGAAAADGRTGATPRIYKWVDANGIAHYTTDPERVPKALRNRIESVERAQPNAPAAEAEAGAASQPAPTPTPTAPAPSLAGTSEPPEVPVETSEPPEVPVGTSEPPGVLAETSELPEVPEFHEAPEVPSEPGARAATEPAPPTMGSSGPVPLGAGAPATLGARAPTTIGASVPAPTAAPVATAESEPWATRDAAPRLRSRAELLAAGNATPAELAALEAERQALDARIAEVEAEIARDETVLKDLISDPDLEADVPLFDRPEFLEISRRLPGLQARLQELRDERAKLGTP